MFVKFRERVKARAGTWISAVNPQPGAARHSAGKERWAGEVSAAPGEGAEPGVGLQNAETLAVGSGGDKAMGRVLTFFLPVGPSQSKHKEERVEFPLQVSSPDKVGRKDYITTGNWC